MDLFTKLYTKIHDAVIDPDRPFCDLKVVVDGLKEVRPTVQKIAHNLGLDCLISSDAVWPKKDE